MTANRTWLPSLDRFPLPLGSFSKKPFYSFITSQWVRFARLLAVGFVSQNGIAPSFESGAGRLLPAASVIWHPRRSLAGTENAPSEGKLACDTCSAEELGDDVATAIERVFLITPTVSVKDLHG